MKHTKLFLLLLLALLTVSGASAQSLTDAKELPVKKRTKMERENRQIIFSNFEKFNRGDTTSAADDWSDDLTNHGEKVGRSGIKMVLDDIIRTFPDAKLEIQSLVVDGDMAVVRTLFTGTHRGVGQLPVNGGMLIGVEPTGKSFAVNHIHWFRLRDRRIVAHWATRDDVEMMRQLGLPLEIKSKAVVSDAQP
jgi:predicted ester cyclase